MSKRKHAKGWPDAKAGMVDCHLGAAYYPPPLANQGQDTSCKHGDGACETCGTSGRRDTIHTTDERGRGAVGRAISRVKKSR